VLEANIAFVIGSNAVSASSSRRWRRSLVEDRGKKALDRRRYGRQKSPRKIGSAQSLRQHGRRTRGQRGATGPMPVIISRSGRCPWRTSRRRPSSSACRMAGASKAATSASTAWANNACAPLRNNLGQRIGKGSWLSELEDVISVSACHSFSGAVEASNTPRYAAYHLYRHQLSPENSTLTVNSSATRRPKLSKRAARMKRPLLRWWRLL
jgi:hypothetical protein